MEQTISEIQDNAKKYRIKWVNNYNPGRGVSRKTFTRPEAEELARELNREFPKITHTIEPV